MRVEKLDIKVCSFEPNSAETVGSDVETCTILGIRSGIGENFPGD